MKRLPFIGKLALFLLLLVFTSSISNSLNPKSKINVEPKSSDLVGQVLQDTCTPITCSSGLYWNDSTCACEVCEPRDCGGAMYLDMTDCVCKCPSYPTCTADEYWEQWSCSCIPYASSGCTEPSDGCPTGTYWDTAYCSCITSFTCQESTAGCGSDYYWDTTSCICLPYESTNTTCVPEYCGVNHYWDEDSCLCKCASYVACPTNYYWSVSSCSCLPYTSTTTSGGDSTTTTTTTCTPPSAGCAVNYYWDYASCSCKPDESYSIGGADCYPPTDGCEKEYYWDYDTCSCKYDSSIATSTCTKPLDSCQTGYYWDYNSCSCVYSQTSLDRLAYESTEIITCIKSKLTEYEYQRLRYFIPTTQQGSDEIQNLGNKVATCWSSTASEQNSSTQTSGTPLTKEQCLINSIGNTAYREIYEGRRTPTQNEYLWFQKCFGKVQKNVISLLSADEKVSDKTVTCLKKTLGNDLYQKVYSGQAQIPQNLRKGVNICFDAKPQPFEQGTSLETPQAVKDCLYEAVSETKLKDIISGKVQVTGEEKEKAKQCFDNLNQEQQKFLPPPAEEIPFFDQNEAIKFEKADQEKIQVKKKTYGGKLTLSGKAQPNTIVTIYIYSDPIVVTTKTDENGDWVYEMQKPLDEGKHVAYALVKSDKEGYIRSSLINFDVLASEEEPTPVFIDEQGASEARKRFIYYSLGAVLFITLVVTGGIYFIHTRKKIKEIEESDSEGNSETKPGTGPVN